MSAGGSRAKVIENGTVVDRPGNGILEKGKTA